MEGMQSEYLPIKDWCMLKFGFVPSPTTLALYKKNNQIQPAPVKFGRKTLCHRDAKYYALEKTTIETDNPLLQKVFG